VLLREFYQHFKYQNIMTEDIVAYFNAKTGKDLTPIFDQYLRHTALPTLELAFNEQGGTVSYRWKADELRFAMPVRVGTRDHWQIIYPTVNWKTMKTQLKMDQFEVATDLYFVDVVRQSKATLNGRTPSVSAGVGHGTAWTIYDHATAGPQASARGSDTQQYLQSVTTASATL
jgi:hypothetical protein